MGFRRKARECALQMMFQIDIGGERVEGVRRGYWRAHPAPDAVREYADRLVAGASRERDRLDERIARCSANWRIERMGVVDRNVLRIALYELLFETDVPPKAVINEAIEVVRKFGTDESAPFINGILDGALGELEAV